MKIPAMDSDKYKTAACDYEAEKGARTFRAFRAHATYQNR